MTRKKPNIILLVLDTQRTEHMSMYGYHKETTPMLGEFAEGSTVFDWAIATAQWTIPSHASMFTGLYPTIHQTVQSYTTLPEGFPTIAELLQQNDYHTVAFCNNPLVGVLDNGLKRGFDQFFNYSATFPDIPKIGEDNTLRKVQRTVTELLQKVSTPIEREFGRSSVLLKMAMMPIFVPFWTRLGKFKGDTRQSTRDIADYLRYRNNTHPDQPLFMFINMMETHLPYYPPRKVIDRWVPYYKKDREARDFLQRYNTQSYRWVAPMLEPFSELQETVLRDMYDAEIAYQDQQLRRMLRYLRRSGLLDDTMVIVTSDHGESHGDHRFMGHAFVIYNEIVRVPLFIHYPERFPAGRRVTHNVSTRRVFHTMLEAAGLEHEAYGHTAADLSLTRSIEGPHNEPEDEVVVAEAFPPLNFINVMEMNNPEAIEPFRVKLMRRAVFEDHAKLMTVNDRPDEFFDINKDRAETHNLLDNPAGYENDILRLERKLESFISLAEAHRDGTAAGNEIDFSSDPELLERLRGLGYIE
jgi:arylsulfatase A-like enzyme